MDVSLDGCFAHANHTLWKAQVPGDVMDVHFAEKGPLQRMECRWGIANAILGTMDGILYNL